MVAAHNILTKAQQMFSGIRTAATIEDAKLRKAALQQMLSEADASEQSDILSYINSAGTYIDALEIEHTEAASRIAAERFVLGRDAEQLYDSLKEKGLFSKEEQKELDKIKDDKVYRIQKLDANGNPIKDEYEYVTGAEIKRSAIALKADSHRHLLSEKDRELLTRVLEDNRVNIPSARGDASPTATAARIVKGFDGELFKRITGTDSEEHSTGISSFRSEFAALTPPGAPAAAPTATPKAASASAPPNAVEDNINGMLEKIATTGPRPQPMRTEAAIQPAAVAAPNAAALVADRREFSRRMNEVLGKTKSADTADIAPKPPQASIVVAAPKTAGPTAVPPAALTIKAADSNAAAEPVVKIPAIPLIGENEELDFSTMLYVSANPNARQGTLDRTNETTKPVIVQTKEPPKKEDKSIAAVALTASFATTQVVSIVAPVTPQVKPALASALAKPPMTDAKTPFTATTPAAGLTGPLANALALAARKDDMPRTGESADTLSLPLAARTPPKSTGTRQV